MSWTLKPLTREHIPAAAALFNQSVADGEMIFSPLDEAVFERRFFQPGAHAFAAEENGELIGFIHGACKTAFLNKENNENTPGYLSVVVVRKDKRRQGVGSALVAALEDAFRAAGKRRAACNDSTPVHMNWTIPGTPGHDHNNAPGVDERCEGYPFLLHRGYQAAFTEIAMYLDLSKFQWDPALDAKITALNAEGIRVGRWTPDCGTEHDRLCDHVGSEYWRHVLDTELEGSTQSAEPAEPNAPHIQFDHVTFSYNHVSPNVHDVSFSLKKGQTLGILGPTGAGKSTLIRLLLRFYDADSGCIRIDGQDVRSMELSSLRGRIGAVFQNDALFRGEIGENIRLGREITLDEVNDAIRRAQAESFIEEKGGVNSEVQSHGSNFSGGQQQRLLLSRALAGTPDILLLDDATSALDFKTESAFRQALREQSKATTTIIIAQRISAVMHCDQILVMEDGEMLGLGTHEELMQSCPLYQEIAALQIGGEAQ